MAPGFSSEPSLVVTVPPIVGIGAVGIQSGVAAAVAGEIQGAAIDGQVAVGINTVSLRGDGESTAVDQNKAVRRSGRGKLILLPHPKAGAVGPAGGVEPIVLGGDTEGAAVNGDGQTFQALIAIGNGEVSILDQKIAVGMDGVVTALQLEGSRCDGNVPTGVNGIIGGIGGKGAAIHLECAGGADCISLGIDLEFTILDVDRTQGRILGVFAAQAVLAAGEGKGPSGNGQAVLALQAVIQHLHLYPDRCRHQPGQQRRCSAQHGR